MVGGINGSAGSNGNLITTWNCYNIGNIIGNSTIGEITGWNNANGGSSQDINCYSTDASVELLNSGEYSNDEWTIKAGVNNGYPILKWQLGNN